MLEDERDIEDADDTAYVAACQKSGGFPVGVNLAPMAATSRRVKPVSVRGLEPNPVSSKPPTFALVDPEALIVAEAYQRGLSDAGVRLVRKIVAGWDWRKFKPPVVAKTPAGLEVIDGQHTAIAAATHPDIKQIPVMVVEAAQETERAAAFIGHNRDRLGVTPMQIHHSAVAAGDATAMTIARVAEAAGARILRTPPSGAWKACETVAVAAIGKLVRQRGEAAAIAVLKALVDARCAPIGAGMIKAVDVLLHDAEFTGEIAAETVTHQLALSQAELEQEANVFAAAHGVPIWKALAVTIFKNRPKRRRAGA